MRKLWLRKRLERSCLPSEHSVKLTRRIHHILENCIQIEIWWILGDTYLIVSQTIVIENIEIFFFDFSCTLCPKPKLQIW
jgi:hypothetical protein